MRRFEYGRIQSLTWDMDILSLIAGIYRANGKEEVLLSQSPCGVGVSCGVGKGAEYGGFKCD